MNSNRRETDDVALTSKPELGQLPIHPDDQSADVSGTHRTAGEADDDQPVGNGDPEPSVEETRRVRHPTASQVRERSRFTDWWAVHAKQPGVLVRGAEDQVLLDAWFADHSSSVTRAVLRDRPKLMAEVVQGRDDRTRVTRTRDFPYRCICSLVITAGDGTPWVGTGWLAGPRTVVTAGHCVYMRTQGGWARQIAVFPARNGQQIWYQVASRRFRSVEGWTVRARPEADYGAILLPETPAIGALGFFGYSVLANSELSGLAVTLAGYPADKTGQLAGTLWEHARRLTSLASATLTYDIDTYGGQSGAPVFFQDNGAPYAVGIHNYGDLTGNSATRITDRVFENIERWKGEVVVVDDNVA
jgi:V8-like Glu-specific endopeptidase